MNGGSNDLPDASLVVTECWRVSSVSSFDQLQLSGIDRTLSGGAPGARVPTSSQLQRGSREGFS